MENDIIQLDRDGLQLILNHGFELSEQQQKQILLLGQLYRDWNSKINVVSRKDIDQLYMRHILHSLLMSKYVDFSQHSHIVDVGCGGGFPGIPLAILFPDIQFDLVDSRGKKILVVHEVAEAIGLTNVKGIHARIEELKTIYDAAITRAVAPISQLISWTKKNIKGPIYALKGGDLKEEIIAAPNHYTIDLYMLSDETELSFFETKYVMITSKQ